MAAPLRAAWNALKDRFRVFAASPPALRRTMFALLWAYIVVFSVGPNVREFFPSLCLLCLILYYRQDWKNSTLRKFTARPLFIFFYLAAASGIIFSQDIPHSFLHVMKGANKAFILPFVAMECVREEKDLRRLVWAFVLAAFWQGCNGIWQSVTGYDFIDHTPPIYGRLTGSLSDYRVGNYMALILIPAASVWFFLRERLSRWAAVFCLALLLGPGLYLLYFTYTRNAYLTVMVGGVLWLMLCGRRPRWNVVALLGGAGVLLAALLPQRLSLAVISGDGRWDLWQFAWAIFKDHPLTGVGFWNYNAAFREMGLVPGRDPITISHPHSIYLQLLCESGILGFTLAMIFLFGMLIWGWRAIGPLVRAEVAQAHQDAATSAYWRITAVFWCVWGAYLVSGIAGHDFFRIWWQAVVMTHLGIMIGAVVNGHERLRVSAAQADCAEQPKRE